MLSVITLSGTGACSIIISSERYYTYKSPNPLVKRLLYSNNILVALKSLCVVVKVHVCHESLALSCMLVKITTGCIAI